MKTVCLLISLLLLGSYVLVAQTEPTDSDSDGKREVSTLDHLLWISLSSTRWSYQYEQTADINASATSGWNSGAGFSPIGNNTTKFTGSYDGQNHTISGLYINRSSDWTGLFGFIEGAEISNLGVTEVNISGAYGTGGLAGDNYNSSTINNCYSTGTVSGTYYVGGLVGINQSASISNSYSSCTVSGVNTNIGGLIGDNNGSTVSQCYATGSVSGTNVVGGLIGYNRNTTTVSNNYCRGNVSRSSGSLTDVGSFCGNNSFASILYSYATGTVSCGGATNKGFVGANSSGSYTANFFDADASSQLTGTGAAAKTTAEMKTQTTFTNAGWSNTIWNMGDGVNDGYAYLDWQNPSGTALPVELTSFTGSTKNGAVILKWSTATETNNYGFDIEKLSNFKISKFQNSEWQPVGFIHGHGTAYTPNEYTFSDKVTMGGSFSYRLKQIDRDGNFTYSSAIEVSIAAAPAVFGLEQNYPNPFNPTTDLSFTVGATGYVTLMVFNGLGQEVGTLFRGLAEAGTYHRISFNAAQLPSGTYFAKLTAGDKTQIRKMLLMK
jgi:hypothetical protein